jgi:hypothetical protein
MLPSDSTGVFAHVTLLDNYRLDEHSDCKAEPMTVRQKRAKGPSKRALSRATEVVFRLAIIVLVALQFGRVYVNPQNLALCLSKEMPTHTEHHHDEAGAVPAHNDDSGSSFQHCKDSDESLISTSLPVVLPSSEAEFYLPEAVVTAELSSSAFVENILAPPYHPPRVS